MFDTHRGLCVELLEMVETSGLIHIGDCVELLEMGETSCLIHIGCWRVV